MTDLPVGVLFVCPATICRSPLAHGIFVHLLRERGLADRFVIDSAGTWAAAGIAPHPGSVAVAAKHGIALDVAGLSRGIEPDDLQRFHHVIAMDRDNEADILRLGRLSAFGPTEGDQAWVRLLRTIDSPGLTGRGADVPDPVRGGPEAFAAAYEIVDAGCRALLDDLLGDGSGGQP